MQSQQINLYGKYNKKTNKIEFSNPQSIKDWTKNLEDGEDIVVKFNISREYKTFRQVRLAYSCLRKLSQDLGYTVEECKMLMKLNQGLCASHEIEGTSITFCKSISEMTKKELSDFIMNMDIWSIKTLGYPILSNDDKIFLKS